MVMPHLGECWYRHAAAADVDHQLAAGRQRRGRTGRVGEHQGAGRSHGRRTGGHRKAVDGQAQVSIGLGRSPHGHQHAAFTEQLHRLGLGAHRANGVERRTARRELVAHQQQAARHAAQRADGAGEVDLGRDKRHEEVQAQQVGQCHV